MKTQVGLLTQFLLTAALVICSETISGRETESILRSSSAPAVGLAVLPFANYTGQIEAAEMFSPLIKDRIERSGFRLAISDTVDKELRKKRIRSTATIGSDDAAAISRDLNVDFILLGSLDIFQAGGTPEAAISVRVVDAHNMTVIWAISAALSGADFVRMLGVGRVTSMEELAGRLVDRAFKGFDSEMILLAANDSSGKAGPLHTVVVFDNLSENRFAGDIISAIALSELKSNNIRVLEPGAAMMIFRENGQFPRGEIGLELVKQLNDKWNVQRVITGSVDVFRPAPADVEGTYPEVELGGRYLDASTGKVLSAVEMNRSGGDSESVLGLGVKHSLGKVAEDATRDFLEKLHVFGK